MPYAVLVAQTLDRVANGGYLFLNDYLCNQVSKSAADADVAAVLFDELGDSHLLVALLPLYPVCKVSNRHAKAVGVICADEFDHILFKDHLADGLYDALAAIAYLGQLFIQYALRVLQRRFR